MSEKRQATIAECILVEGVRFTIGERQYQVKKVGCLVHRNIIINTRTRKEANPPKDSICEVSFEDANKIAKKLIEIYNTLQTQVDQLRSRILTLKTSTQEEYDRIIDEFPLEGLSDTAKKFVRERLQLK